ncbi:MAG: hypothetical protein JHD02_06730 [Thermoleophilaceae bacterium]|nr:hypothetical protein [Thermoleophilaceae bacterium]
MARFLGFVASVIVAMALPASAHASFSISSFGFSAAPTSADTGSALTASISPVATGGDDLRDLTLSLPPGMTYDLAAAASRCSSSLFLLDRCPAASLVGTIRASAGLTLGPLTLFEGTSTGSLYALASSNSIGAVIRTSEFGKTFLKQAITVSGSTTSLRLSGLPRSLSLFGLFPVGTNLNNITLHYNRTTTPAGSGPLVRNPSSCAASQAVATAVSYRSATATRTASFAATGCDSTGPIVSISSPQDASATSSSTAELQFTATDDSGTVSSCTRTSGETISLTQGANVISVSCLDPRGNVGSASATIEYVPPAAAVETDVPGQLGIADLSPARAPVDNRLTVTEEAGSLIFRDLSTPLTPPATCVSTDQHTISCPAHAISVLNINGGSGDDEIDVAAPVDAVIHGGDGNDVLTADLNDRLFGGPGDDVLSSGPGDDQLFGGPGDDVLAGQDGDDQLVGEAGRDAFVGGPGSDAFAAGDGEIDDLYCDAFDRSSIDGDDNLNDCTSGISASPMVVITGGPLPGQTILSSTVELSFEVYPDSPGVAVCAVDALSEPAGIRSPCESPETFGPIPDGQHWLWAVVTQNGWEGLWGPPSWLSTPGTIPFTVDTSAPDISIVTPADGSTIYAPTVQLDFEVNDVSQTSCTPTDLDILGPYSPGQHTVVVACEDEHGHRAAVESTFEVANPVPETEITTGPPAITDDDTPTFEFAGGDAHECSFDGEPFALCVSPFTSASALADSAAHSFSVRGLNAQGDSDPTPATRNFFVDTGAFGATLTYSSTDRVAARHPDLTITESFRGVSAVDEATVILPKGMHIAPAGGGSGCLVSFGTPPCSSQNSQIGVASLLTIDPDGVLTPLTGTLHFKAGSPETFGDTRTLFLEIDGFPTGTMISGGISFTANATNSVLSLRGLSARGLHIRELELTLFGSTGAPSHPLLTNPSACTVPAGAVPAGTATAFTGSAVASGGSQPGVAATPGAYTTFGCSAATPPYAPTFTQVLSNPIPGETSGMTVALDFPAGHSTTRTIEFTEPAKIEYNRSVLGANEDQCASSALPNPIPGVGAPQFDISTCPAQSQIGTLTVTSPLFDSPLVGQVYLVSGGIGGRIGIDFNEWTSGNPSGINVAMRGDLQFIDQDSLFDCDMGGGETCPDLMRYVFDSIPDIPISRMVLDLTSGPRTDSSGEQLTSDVLRFAPPGDISCADGPVGLPQTAVTNFRAWSRAGFGPSVQEVVSLTGC